MPRSFCSRNSKVTFNGLTLILIIIIKAEKKKKKKHLKKTEVEDPGEEPN